MASLSRINTNVGALKAFLTLNTVNSKILKFQEQISTGKTVNRASDDPSGYYAAKVLNKQINVKGKKILQIERGINFLQSNSTKLNTVADLLLEISGLASSANSGAVSSAEKSAIQLDIQQLRLEIESIMQSGVSSRIYRSFSLGDLENVYVSGTNTAGARITAFVMDPLANLGIDGTNVNVSAGGNAQAAITAVTSALENILEHNEQLGSYIRRLQFEQSDAETEIVDLKASLSTIQDADLAEVQLDLTKSQILQQTALAMLSQANTAPQSILTLFGG